MTFRIRIANALVSLVDRALRLAGRRLHDFTIRGLYSRFVPTEHSGSDINIVIWSPESVAPNHSERPLVERIFAAYRRAKTDQGREDPVFLPADLWQKLFERSYADLISAGKTGQLDRFHFFLSNFGSLSGYTGINHSHLVREHSRTASGRRSFERRIMAPMIDWWLKYEGVARDLSELSAPRHGNQCGAIIENRFVGVDAILNEFYARTIARLIAEDRPIIAELGAGYGILFHFLSRSLRNFCYLDFDLPETLSCATYYLMKAFPDKRFLLYGEGVIDDEALEHNDFIMFPSYRIGNLPDRAVDMFLNNSSLGEMKPDTCRRFVSEICRTANRFWHMNHEYLRNSFGDGTASLVNREYPVPTDSFRLVFRYIDAVNARYKGVFDSRYDIYSYYFERI